MTEVRVGVRGAHFGPNHAMSGVDALVDVCGFERLGKTGPAAAAFELVERGEEGLHGIPKGILEWPLCGAALGNAKLLGRQPIEGFLVLTIFPDRVFSAPFRR